MKKTDSRELDGILNIQNEESKKTKETEFFGRYKDQNKNKQRRKHL